MRVRLVSGWRGNRDLYPNTWGLSSSHTHLIVTTLFEVPCDVLIHGGAPGVDSYVDLAIVPQPRAIIRMPALWDVFGEAAGNIRNAHMLTVFSSLVACGYTPDAYFFPGPGSVGTWDMLEKVKGSGICQPNVIDLE